MSGNQSEKTAEVFLSFEAMFQAMEVEVAEQVALAKNNQSKWEREFAEWERKLAEEKQTKRRFDDFSIS